MLEGLDQIDWHTLSHAYGEADDVPIWIRELGTLDENSESDALGQLFMSLSHQGTVYSASAIATPFLLELLTIDAVICKASILLLLASFAHGNAYHRQHLSFYSEERKQDVAFQQELTEQIMWVERTHRAAHQGMEIYQNMLSHVDPDVRMNAAYTMAQFREDATTSVPLLRSLLLRERDQSVVASMMLSLATLDEPTEENLSLFKKMLTKDAADEQHALVRFAASIALTWIAKQETPQEAIDKLVDVLTQPKSTSLFDMYVELPWVNGSLAGFAGRTLRQYLPHQRLRRELPKLVEALETVNSYDVSDVIQVLLYIAFGYVPDDEIKFSEPIQREHLTEEQYQVLSAIVQSHGAWHVAPGVYTESSTWQTIGSVAEIENSYTVIVMNNDLQALGLPSVQQDLQDFLREI